MSIGVIGVQPGAASHNLLEKLLIVLGVHICYRGHKVLSLHKTYWEAGTPAFDCL